MKENDIVDKEFNDLIVKRIKMLCKEKKKSIYKVALEKRLPYSTLSTYLRRVNVSTATTTVKHFCDGIGISVAEFYDYKYFK